MTNTRRLVWVVVGSGVALSVVGYLVYPLFAKSRRPMQPACPANLKQLGTALRLYAEDYDDHLPPAKGAADLAGSLARGENGFLTQYVRNDELWICRNDPRWRELKASTSGPRVRPSYRWNDSLSGRALDEIAGPSLVPTLFDREPWHYDKRNVVFVDGHVTWVEETDFQKLGVVGR